MAVNRRATLPSLSVMFGLSIMAKGAASVLLSGHMGELGFSGQQIGYVFATNALAALVSPLIAGWLADRYWSSQTLAAWCHLASAPLLYIAWMQTGFPGFWLTMGLYALIHLPTMMLINVIALYHLGDLGRFGHIRVWGTVGWILISWCLGFYLRLWENWDPTAQRLGDGLLVAAFLYIVAGIYCFTLPHTPPGSSSEGSYSFLSARGLLRKRNFVVLLAISFLSAILSPFLYNFAFLFLTDVRQIGLAPSTTSWVMSLGQVSEVVVLLGLAPSLRRLGIKRILLFGVAAQGLRFAIFALGQPTWLVAGSQILHGIVFGFFNVGLIVAIEHLSEKEYRARAQGLLTFARGGIGSLFGNFTAGRVYDHFEQPGGGHAWRAIFLVPTCIAVLGLAMFGLLFREDRRQETGDRRQEAGGRRSEIRDQ